MLTQLCGTWELTVTHNLFLFLQQGVKDGRVQFSIAGQQGPNSYRFGYDTGKGYVKTNGRESPL